MSRILYRPEPDKRPWATRYFVGMRLAWLYCEGTVVEARDGSRWVNVHDHEFDSFPWWEKVTQVG